jgi:hypothetical protein
MPEEFESKFPTVGVALLLGLPVFYLLVLNDWWLAGGQLDAYAGCTTGLVGTKCWWQQDIVSQLFHDAYASTIVPLWNLLVATASGRVVISGVVIALYGALVAPVVKHLYTWWHTAMR